MRVAKTSIPAIKNLFAILDEAGFHEKDVVQRGEDGGFSWFPNILVVPPNHSLEGSPKWRYPPNHPFLISLKNHPVNCEPHNWFCTRPCAYFLRNIRPNPCPMSSIRVLGIHPWVAAEWLTRDAAQPLVLIGSKATASTSVAEPKPAPAARALRHHLLPGL